MFEQPIIHSSVVIISRKSAVLLLASSPKERLSLSRLLRFVPTTGGIISTNRRVSRRSLAQQKEFPKNTKVAMAIMGVGTG